MSGTSEVHSRRTRRSSQTWGWQGNQFIKDYPKLESVGTKTAVGIWSGVYTGKPSER
jgi:hypothetical protein